MSTNLEHVRSFEWTALHEAGHYIVARANNVTITGASLVARRTDYGSWIGVGSGSGIRTDGTHANGTVRPECARQCFAVALAGSLAERLFRGMDLPTNPIITSLIAPTDTTDLSEALAAEKVINEPNATMEIARSVFSLLDHLRTELVQESKRLLGFLESSAARPERHGIRFEAGYEKTYTFIAHRWTGPELSIDLIFDVQEFRTPTGVTLLASRQSNGDWRILSGSPDSGFNIGDFVVVDHTGMIRATVTGGGYVTVRAHAIRHLKPSEYDDLDATGAIIIDSSERDVLVVAVPRPALLNVSRVLSASGSTVCSTTK